MDDVERHPHIAKLSVGSILAGAVRLYRLEPARVAGASLLILFPAVLVSRGVHAITGSGADGILHDRAVLVTVLPALSGFVTLLGLVLLGGVMDELVGAAIRGTPMPRVTEAVRALPLARLVAADVVVALMIGAASAIGTLPGLVLGALVGIVGPVVNIERWGPARAIGRSVRLTWPHAWVAIEALVPVLLVEGVAHGVLLYIWKTLGLLGELVVEILLILTVGAALALIEVVLAYALMARDPASRVAAMIRRTPRSGSPASG